MQLYFVIFVFIFIFIFGDLDMYHTQVSLSVVINLFCVLHVVLSNDATYGQIHFFWLNNLVAGIMNFLCLMLIKPIQILPFLSALFLTWIQYHKATTNKLALHQEKAKCMQALP
ncbi:hypothetical protein ACJX0J_014699 [Zea mays]